MPNVEFTPVFSPTDCAKAVVEINADVEINSAAAVNLIVLFLILIMSHLQSSVIRGNDLATRFAQATRPKRECSEPKLSVSN
jgi:hypothetical protein